MTLLNHCNLTMTMVLNYNIFTTPGRRKKTLREIYDATEDMTTTKHVYLAFSAGKDLVTYDEASKDEKWVHAMKEEIKSIEKNDI